MVCGNVEGHEVLRLRCVIHFVNFATPLRMTKQFRSWTDSSRQEPIAKSRAGLNRHWADFFFHFDCVDHRDGIPRATVEEASVRAFTQAFLAADAEDGIDGDTAERRIVFVGHPEHAVFDWAVFDAGG